MWVNVLAADLLMWMKTSMRITTSGQGLSGA